MRNCLLVSTQCCELKIPFILSNFVLEMSAGIESPISLNVKLTIALFICWILAFLALVKGIQSLGKVSYVTAIFPYIMIFALIIRGVTLPGSMKGIIYYIGTVDFEKLATLKVFHFLSSRF
jgi:SNF family Na+-dependent transporter